MNNSLVSICIPTYNGEKYIAEAIQSAIEQTYPNLEIVISDDASKDHTLKVIENFKSKTNIPIKIYHHQPNGIGANWNHSIKKANGVYIKFLFQDDVLEPTCIEEMVKVMENDTSVGLVASKRDFIIDKDYITDQSEKWVATYGDLQRSLKLTYSNDIGIIDKSLFKSQEFFKTPLNKFGEPTTFLFRKNILNKIGLFREDMKQVLDYEFCYRLLKKKKIAIIDKKLVKFRLHSLQATNLNKGNDGEDYKKLHQLYLKEYFWLLNHKKQLYIIEKNYKYFGYFMSLIRKIIK